MKKLVSRLTQRWRGNDVPAEQAGVAADLAAVDPYMGPSYALLKRERIARQQEREVDIVICAHNALDYVKPCLAYRHGEAIGLGMLGALRLSGADALRAEVCELLARHGLPTTLDSAVASEDVLAAIARDKKADAYGVPFVLVKEPGDVVTGERLDGASVRAAVEELRKV